MGSRTQTLDSLCELIVDCPHSTPKWTDSGIVVLRNQNIRNGQLDLSSPSFTNEDDYQKRIKRATPQPGDIVFTREAPMGEVCLIPEGLKCCLGQRQVLLRPRSDVSGEYVFWALQSPHVQHQISWNEGTGTTVSNVRIPVLKALQIPRHPDNEDDVAKVLSSLARRIELNQQTNQTLEKMAQALFKSWFVDFDPVVDNALAAGSPIPDELAHRVEVRKKAHALPDFQPLPEHIRNLFPSEFEQTDEQTVGIDGWVPKGWGIDNLKGYSTKISKGTTPRKKDIEEANKPLSVPFLKVKDMGDNGQINHESLELIPREVHSNQLKRSILAKGDIIFSIAGTIGRVSQITSELDGINCNQAIAFIRPLSTRHGLWLKFFLGTVSAQNQVKNKITQAVQANVNLTDLGNLRFVSPSKELLAEFEYRIKPINEKCELIFKSNRSLKKVRDTLLPELISGEIQLDSSSDGSINQDAELQGV